MLSAALLGAGAVLVWALALYVGSRAPARLTPSLAAAAMLCLTAYLTGETLNDVAPDTQRAAAWLQWTWWGQSLAAPLWLVLVLALAVDEGPANVARLARRALRPVGAFGLVLGAVFAALALRESPRGELLRAYQSFALVCIVCGFAGLMWLWRVSAAGSPLRARFAGLSASGLLFVLGGAWLVFASGVYGQPPLLGQGLLIAGMVWLGWNMARYGALLASEEVGGDFVAFVATMLGIVGLYGAVAMLLSPDPAWIERALPLLLLVMTTHVVVDTRGHLLDRVVYAPLLSTMRGQLRELGNRVVRQPDELAALADVRETVDEILRQAESGHVDLRVLVEGALRHMNDLPTLSQHALVGALPSISGYSGSPLERAAALRNELDRAIERLRPTGARPTPGSSAIGGWLHYLVLKEAYVDGRPNKQIMQRYALSEGTFHRARRRAIDAVAADLSSTAQALAAAAE